MGHTPVQSYIQIKKNAPLLIRPVQTCLGLESCSYYSLLDKFTCLFIYSCFFFSEVGPLQTRLTSYLKQIYAITELARIYFSPKSFIQRKIICFAFAILKCLNNIFLHSFECILESIFQKSNVFIFLFANGL